MSSNEPAGSVVTMYPDRSPAPSSALRVQPAPIAVTGASDVHAAQIASLSFCGTIVAPHTPVPKPSACASNVIAPPAGSAWANSSPSAIESPLQLGDHVTANVVGAASGANIANVAVTIGTDPLLE